MCSLVALLLQRHITLMTVWFTHLRPSLAKKKMTDWLAGHGEERMDIYVGRAMCWDMDCLWTTNDTTLHWTVRSSFDFR